jgi:hypothetical protein
MGDRNAALPVPAGRPSKLTPELVEAAKQHAADGLPVGMIASLLGVHRATCSTWIKKADEEEEGSLHHQFREAIFFADAEYCRNLLTGIKKQADGGNPWAATWLLTHHPRLRDHFSDAAADRRVERKTVATVMDALASAGLTPDDERRVLLQIQARGLGTPPADEGEP